MHKAIPFIHFIDELSLDSFTVFIFLKLYLKIFLTIIQPKCFCHSGINILKHFVRVPVSLTFSIISSLFGK